MLVKIMLRRRLPINIVSIFLCAILLSSCSLGRVKEGSQNTITRPAISEDREIRNAILSGDVSTVEYLLNKNPDLIELEDDDENTLLHYAVWKGDIRIVNVLIEHNADVNAQNRWGFAPLHELARREENNEVRDIAKRLIQYGAKVNLVTNYGNTPLDIAEIKGKKELIRIYRENGGKRNKHALNLPPIPEFARDLK